ncbi:MAG: hypothetical protein U0Q19_10315 [Kineosporiaceae bacterium]
MSPRMDNAPPFRRAMETAASLKAGSWESVEALAVLAIAARGRPEAAEVYRRAAEAAADLKPGNWQAVRALAWLAQAQLAVPPEG